MKKLTTKQLTAVPPMEQLQLDRIIAAYGGSFADLSEDQPATPDAINILLYEDRGEDGMLPANELLNMPPNCLEEI